MEGRKRIAVVGSDARQAAAGRALARAGYAVAGAEQVARADVILLPLPLDESRTPLAQLLRAAKPGAFALGGRLFLVLASEYYCGCFGGFLVRTVKTAVFKQRVANCHVFCQKPFGPSGFVECCNGLGALGYEFAVLNQHVRGF